MRQYIEDHPWLLILIVFTCFVGFMGTLALALLMGGMSNS